MYLKHSKTPQSVRTETGEIISRSDLPDPTIRRWVASRKAIVVKAVLSGLLPPDEACQIYALSAEELGEWCVALEKYGERALKTTNLQEYR